MNSMVTGACIIGLAVVCALCPARAEDESFAVVVMVNDKEIVFDKGVEDGIKKGDRVGLYRTITVHHPVTGKDITDKFPIGDVKVKQVSELLSIISNSKKLSHPPKVGDLVRLYKVEEKEKALAAAAQKEKGEESDPKTEGVVAKLDPECGDINQVMNDGLGRPIDKRISKYNEFLKEYPDCKHRKNVKSEIIWLKTVRKQLLQPPSPSTLMKPEEKKEEFTALHSPLDLMEVGDEVQAVIAALPPESVSRAHLYLRKSDEAAFDQVEMTNEGVYYYRADIPEKYLRKPNRFLYFIELTKVDGEVLAVAGDEKRPLSVKVRAPIVDNNVRENRSVARAVFDYVNFDMDKNVDDEYWSFEADYFYRLYKFLYGVRVGMGFFNGTGGTLSDIEQSPDNNNNIAAIYGFVEGEFEVVPLFHFMLRGLAGNQRAPGESQSQAAGVFGLEGGVRIGEELKTNLVLAGAIFQEVGYEGRIALEINQFRKVPISLQGLVTNFPTADSHLGMSIVLGAGYRFTDRFAILARGSWNARTITHTGFGGGASAALSW